ncbi:MAG: taurine ABC transporter substrate-binding protein [Paracoccus sp.]|uniref:taurine ABC transporter substrate-binding protein n=1 Tax=Paracoccus sp. TaxID=267 RepID=UPI000C6B23EB|nr:taurine ABC transporter substrate-binding protein [Paracoccus sp. (in: a-proteobacteria)]MAN55109.1 taurine ABC transporter substrate-binding protein [Paracoccus sp. (in: a-proteobacteria)]MBA48040.1 taurine ABC transporter substrate-binding protein [Paracoccus sp. (in: a-proteobacteria)]
MSGYFRTTMTAAAALLALSGGALAQSVVIGHFGNPTPMQVAASEGKFSEATGWDVEWRKFAAGTDVIAAMASGDIKVAELGSSPLAIAATQGVDLEMFMVAQVIGNAESLIVRDGSEIATIEDLKGKRIATPVGSTAHFSLMGVLAKAGLSTSDVNIMSMPPDQIAAAWEQGAIDGAFIWQPVQNQLLQSGTRLVGADQTAEWGYPTFDAWVVNKQFAEQNREGLIGFIKTINDANNAYLDDKQAWTADSEQVKIIADYTGADPAQVPDVLSGYTFLPLSEQVKPEWLGGGLSDVLKSTAEFLKEAGRIDSVGEDYAPFVTDAYVKAAQ